MSYIIGMNGVMVELVDTTDSKSVAARRGGSTPPNPTKYRDVAQSGSASGLGPEGRRFKSCHPDHFSGAVAQLVRAASLYLVLASDKRKVVGSSPTSPTNIVVK